MRLDAIDENGRILETSTNLPIDVTVKTRRNQAAVNRRDQDYPASARHRWGKCSLKTAAKALRRGIIRQSG